MDGIGILVGIVAFALALVALNRSSKLQTRIFQLGIELDKAKEQLGRLSRAVALPERRQVGVDERGAAIYDDASDDMLADAAMQQPTAEAAAPAEGEAATDDERADIERKISEQVSNWITSAPADGQEKAAEDAEPAAAPPVTARPAPKPRDMEQTLASRWFVWIGGVAIAIGGLLFVKYAYDVGLISPMLQVILGLAAGAVLVIAGEVVRRKTMTAAEGQTSYVPAALSAAGLAILFAAVFAAYALYQLVTPATAFGGLALVGLGALVLSRWQGPFIAALGLIGSYATPAMVPAQDPQAWSFFPYLVVILAASFAVLRGRAWWWLGYAAIVGGWAWAALWLAGGAYEPADLWPIGLFAHLLGLVPFFALKGLANLLDENGDGSATWDQPLAIGLMGLTAGAILLGLLVSETHHDVSALGLFAAAMAILVAIAWMRQSLSFLAPAAGVLMFAALVSWDEAAFHAMTLDESGIWTWSNTFAPETGHFLRWMLAAGAAFTLAGIVGVMTRAEARSWGLLGGGGAFLFIWGAWARVDFLMTEMNWALFAAGAALVLLLGTLLANRRAGDPAANLGAGLLAAGAASLLVLAADRLYDHIWYTIAIAVLAFAFAVVSLVLKPRLMGPIAAALATLATVRLFLSRELWSEERGLPWGQHWVVYGYGLPAILFLVGARVLRRSGHDRSAVALEGISLGLVISLISLELRVLISGGITYEEPQFLEMAAHILTWLGAAYGLMYRQGLYSSLIATWGSRALIAGASAAMLLFSLTSLNPVVSEAPVAGNLALNALTLAYLAPAILIGLIALRFHVIGWQALKPAAGAAVLLLAFVYVTLETKLVFQGKIMVAESLSLAESYAYSAVWLVFALALFIAGLRLRKQYVRYAGLAVMVLVVLKVFLLDMSNLEGLYRIASFVGLGLCLVGIGWLYQRFVQRPQGEAA